MEGDPQRQRTWLDVTRQTKRGQRELVQNG